MTVPLPDASYSALFAFVEDRTRVSPEETIRAVAAPLIAQAFRDFAADLNRETQATFSDHAPSDGESAYLSGLDVAARSAERHADELAPPEVDAADGLPADGWRPA